MRRILRIIGGMLLGVFIAISTTGCTSNKPKEAVKVEEKAKEEKPVVNEQKNDNKAEIEYLTKFTIILTDSAQAMGELSYLFAKPSQDATIVSDKQWRQDIVDAYAIISKNHKELLNTKDVPPLLQEVHDLSIKGFEKFIESRNRVLQGVDTKDSKNIIEGVMLMNEGTEYFEQVNEEIKEIIADMS